jgi:hypothetical protein
MVELGAILSVRTTCVWTASALPALSKARYLIVVVLLIEKLPE